ncbi:MAG: hypothetical protein PHO00_03050 [bacterium]|nr:hypothetical protein [bacterium]
MKKIFVMFITVCFLATNSMAGLFAKDSGEPASITINKNTAMLEKETRFQRAWSASYGVLKKMGKITYKNKNAARIEAKIDDAKVKVIIEEEDDKLVIIKIDVQDSSSESNALVREIAGRINDRM